MACPTLEIDSLVVAVEALVRFDQFYQGQRGESFRRTADGTGYQRSTWKAKLGTEINAEGWAPSLFDTLVPGQTYTLKCAVPRTVAGATNLITVPPTRRSGTGYDPYGYAVVDGKLVETGFDNITGDDFTLTPVAGAQSYQVNYFPQIVVAITRNESRKTTEGVYDWRLEAQEV